MNDFVAAIIFVILSSFFFLVALWCYMVQEELGRNDFDKEDSTIRRTRKHLKLHGILSSIITIALLVSGIGMIGCADIAGAGILVFVLASLSIYGFNVSVFFRILRRDVEWDGPKERKRVLSIFVINYGRFVLAERNPKK